MKNDSKGRNLVCCFRNFFGFNFIRKIDFSVERTCDVPDALVSALGTCNRRQLLLLLSCGLDPALKVNKWSLSHFLCFKSLDSIFGSFPTTHCSQFINFQSMTTYLSYTKSIWVSPLARSIEFVWTIISANKQPSWVHFKMKLCCFLFNFRLN